MPRPNPISQHDTAQQHTPAPEIRPAPETSPSLSTPVPTEEMVQLKASELAGILLRLQTLERSQQPAAATDEAPRDASGYRDTDLVTVLHGWGRVEPTRTDGKAGLSKRVYKSVGGVVRDVLYSDARFWQEQWGSKFVKILSRDAAEADFAKATGINLAMDPPKLVAHLESANLGDLIERWGTDRALAWVQRFAEALESVQSDANRRGVRRVPGTTP